MFIIIQKTWRLFTAIMYFLTFKVSGQGYVMLLGFVKDLFKICFKDITIFMYHKIMHTRSNIRVFKAMQCNTMRILLASRISNYICKHNENLLNDRAFVSSYLLLIVHFDNGNFIINVVRLQSGRQVYDTKRFSKIRKKEQIDAKIKQLA